MMRSFFVVVVVIMLAACAQPTRTGPPAPIVSAPTRPPAPTPAPTPTAPQEKTDPVSVYAYRAPSTVAQAPPPERPTTQPGATAVAEEAPQAGDEPPSHSADDAPEPEVAYAPPAEIPDQAEAPELSPAAESLRRQAEQQRQARDYAGAAASLERALRIDQQSAYLWNRLARVRLEQGLVSQAGNLAARSNALAGDQAKLKQDNWAVIAVSRRSAGDAKGAAEAERLSRGG